MLAPHCRRTFSLRPPSRHGTPREPSLSALTAGPELSRLAERKLEPMSWHFILVSSSKAAGILVLYLSPLLNSKNPLLLAQQTFTSATPRGAARGRGSSQRGKEERHLEISGSTEAELTGAGWFTSTPGHTHVCLPAAKPRESSPATSRPDTAPVIKALRLAREKHCWRGLQQVPGQSLCTARWQAHSRRWWSLTGSWPAWQDWGKSIFFACSPKTG